MDGSTPAEGGLTFPCRFPVKILGEDEAALRALAEAVLARHAPPAGRFECTVRPSRSGRFVSLTFVVDATSREQLDAIYRELSAAPQVRMAL